MASCFDEHYCSPLENGEEPNHLLDLARLLIDSGIGAEFQLEFERIFSHVDGRKQPLAAKHIFENLPSTNNFDPNEKCSVCSKEFGLNSTKEVSCHHKYCINCIIQWLKLVNSCPKCRIEFPVDDQDYEQYKKPKQRLKQRQSEIDDLYNTMFS